MSIEQTVFIVTMCVIGIGASVIGLAYQVKRLRRRTDEIDRVLRHTVFRVKTADGTAIVELTLPEIAMIPELLCGEKVIEMRVYGMTMFSSAWHRGLE